MQTWIMQWIGFFHILIQNQCKTTNTAQQPTNTEQKPPTEATPMDTENTNKEASTQPATTEKPPTVHNALCNKCEDQIIGIRYHCKNCRDYDLCPECYADKKHDPEHTFEEFTDDVVIEKRALSKEELEAEKKKLQDKIKKIREDKMQAEALSDMEREVHRVKSGKESQEAKRQHEDRAKQREAAIRKKEEDDDKAAKAKIKAKLEQDKRERAAKKEKEAAAANNSTAPKPVTTATPAPTTTTTTEYTEAMIQVRLPDGNAIKATFKPTDPIRTVHSHIAMLTGSSNFALSTNFPKKVYSPKDSLMDTTTLKQAEQVPSGTFIVTKL